mgnify:CR=1 FL=1
MKFQYKPKKVTAVQWKGWPHKIKGVLVHITYSQLGMINGEEVYVDNWVVTEDGQQRVYSDWQFRQIFEKVK